jgi:hypothetical protein
MQPAGASSGTASRISIKKGRHQECGWSLRVDTVEKLHACSPSRMVRCAQQVRLRTLQQLSPSIGGAVPDKYLCQRGNSGGISRLRDNLIEPRPNQILLAGLYGNYNGKRKRTRFR